MTLDRVVLKELQHPSVMDWELVEKWADGIPPHSQNPFRSEEWLWHETPTKLIDLSAQGYGLVYVKDESHNPTKTIKDRAAWEIAALYRDFAQALYLRRRDDSLNGNIGDIRVPRFSVITAGNMGKAVSAMFARFDLPPIKVLVDTHASPEKLKALQALHADVYLADLGQAALSARDIQQLTNNPAGIDLTSAVFFEPQAVFYDHHVIEGFNQAPDQIYVPYGSGRVFENYLTWQQRITRNELKGVHDSRLHVPLVKVVSTDILGAEPACVDSVADKLTKPFNPFTIFDDQEINGLQRLSFTGNQTGVYRVSEEYILQAYGVLSRHCETEPSAATGLALYLQRYEDGLVDPRKKIVIINTGKGV